ncbi:hypothetical protein AAHE18_20G254000 [Arachis hypogaea]
MKAFTSTLRSLRRTLHSPQPPSITVFHRFFSAQPNAETETETDSNSVFDSSHFDLPQQKTERESGPTWDHKYRTRADQLVFGGEGPKGKLKLKEEGDERRRRVLAKVLLEAAVDGRRDDEEEDSKGLGVVKEEDQKSLSVGIIGAPNAGKSALTNYMVGTKVAAVSRKTNTTTHEVVGVLTKGDTQICFFDTPGLMLNCSGYPYRDVKVRVESAWSSVNLYEVLIVIFDVHRHITR